MMRDVAFLSLVLLVACVMSKPAPLEPLTKFRTGYYNDAWF